MKQRTIVTLQELLKAVRTLAAIVLPHADEEASASVYGIVVNAGKLVAILEEEKGEA